MFELFDTFRKELIDSPFITDNLVIEMLSRMITSRYPNVFLSTMKYHIEKGRFHSNQNLETKLKGLVAIGNDGLLHFNVATAIPNLKDPMKGLTNIKDLYAVILKGCILSLLQRSPMALSPLLLKPAGQLFVDMIREPVFKATATLKYISDERNAFIDAVILNYFFTSVAGLDKNSTKSLILPMVIATYSKNTANKVKEEISKYEVEALSLDDMCEMLNAEFSSTLTAKAIHSYFLVNYNFTYLGLANYKEFLAGTYSMIKTGSFSGKFLLSKHALSTDKLQNAVEKSLR